MRTTGGPLDFDRQVTTRGDGPRLFVRGVDGRGVPRPVGYGHRGLGVPSGVTATEEWSP